jgi:hypothetical protein
MSIVEETGQFDTVEACRQWNNPNTAREDIVQKYPF